MHAGRGSARQPSGPNVRPRCAAHCLTPALDVASHCGDFAEEVVENISCITFPTVPTSTTALGCDGARAPICDLGCLSHLGCNSCCTRELKSGDSQAAMWSRPPTNTTCLKLWLQAPGRTCAAAMHAGRGCAREASGQNVRPRCAAHCLTASLDVSSNCGDFAEEVLENISCIKFPTVPKPTTALGCDGARAPICDMGCLSHLNWNSSCTPDVKSASSQAAMWSRPLTSTTCLKL